MRATLLAKNLNKAIALLVLKLYAGVDTLDSHLDGTWLWVLLKLNCEKKSNANFYISLTEF